MSIADRGDTKQIVDSF